jgi:hypothetical protein
MKEYGIRVTLPEGDPMCAAHLLGADWEYFRWFDSAEARDRAYQEMSRQLPNYTRSDILSQVLEKLER